MKIKDLKHNHSLTDLLKVLIFSILMLLPFLAVGTKALYVICNKNAKDSYSGSKQQPIDVVATEFTEMKPGYRYRMTWDSTQTSSIVATTWNVTNLKDVTNNISYGNANGFRLYATNALYGVPMVNTTQSAYLVNVTVEFTFVSYNIQGNAYQYASIFNLIPNNNSYMDNVFYYAIDEISDNQLFSWTKNTGIYTGVKAMTDNLQITTDVIAVLITYWTLLTVIYVIIDIVLKGFTLLTHMFQKESH